MKFVTLISGSLALMLAVASFVPENTIAAPQEPQSTTPQIPDPGQAGQAAPPDGAQGGNRGANAQPIENGVRAPGKGTFCRRKVIRIDFERAGIDVDGDILAQVAGFRSGTDFLIVNLIPTLSKLLFAVARLSSDHLILPIDSGDRLPVRFLIIHRFRAALGRPLLRVTVPGFERLIPRSRPDTNESATSLTGRCIRFGLVCP